MARRRWEFDLDDGRHVVELEHGYFFGKRLIRADGTLIAQQGRPLMDHSGVYPFRFGAHEGQIVISTNGLTYQYRLVVDGLDVETRKTGLLPRPPVGTAKQQQIGGILLGLVALPMLFFGANGLLEEYRYRSEGVDAIAVGAAKRVLEGRRSTSYELSYFFALPNGRFIDGRGMVSKGSYDRAIPGMRYQIQYVATQPELNRFRGRSDLWSSALLCLIGVTGVGLMTRLALLGRHRADFEPRVAATGTRARARVRKRKRGRISGIGEVFVLEYEYEDADGRTRRGVTPQLYPLEAARYPDGATLNVRYDPDRPRDSVWVDEPVVDAGRNGGRA